MKLSLSQEIEVRPEKHFKYQNRLSFMASRRLEKHVKYPRSTILYGEPNANPKSTILYGEPKAKLPQIDYPVWRAEGEFRLRLAIQDSRFGVFSELQLSLKSSPEEYDKRKAMVEFFVDISKLAFSA